MIELLRLSRALRLAVLALLMAVGASAVALARALTYAPVARPMPETIRTPELDVDTRGVTPWPLAASGHAVANDPFDADRSPLAGREAAGPAPAVVEVVPAASIRLLGTVIRGSGGSFAVCQLPSAIARAVVVGDSIGGMTVVEIARGSAVLRRPDGQRLVLNLSNPGS